MSVVGMDHPEDRSFPVEVEPDRAKTFKVYVRQPADRIEAASQGFNFVVEDKASFESDVYNATFEAPGKSK